MGALVTLLGVCCFIVTSSHASRILLIPFPWKSHVSEISSIGRALAAKGHDIDIIIPPTYPEYEKMKRKSGFNVISYKEKDPDFYTLFPPSDDKTVDFVEQLMDMSPIEDMRMNTEGFAEFCSNILADDDMFEELISLNFDLAIVDSFPCSKCHLVLAYRLGIPYIAMTTMFEPWLLGNPALPSFVPFHIGDGYENTEKMNFMERLSNTYQLLDWSYSTRMFYNSDHFLRPYFKETPFRPINQLAGDSKLWMYNTDSVIDYARPTMPNEVNIGGLSTKPAESLPADLKQLVDDATQGVIITSFGSFDCLSGTKLQRFLDAFRRIDQLVILRSTQVTDEIDIPKNVHIMQWIPQNDLLGHPNARLFITHCGANSQFEALYHGVPMLGFPIFGDQPYNARRVTYRGFGQHLDLLHFTSDQLLGSIKDILGNQSYYDNIRKASAIFRGRSMTPQERAAFWVEEVLQDHVDHLRSHALNLCWWEYLMLDILALVVLVLLAIVILVYVVVYQCCKMCRNKKHKLE